MTFGFAVQSKKPSPPSKLVPHPYQQKGIRWIVSRAAAALFLDPGLGKTAIILVAFKLLKKARIVDRMLVLAPLRPAWHVWPREIEKWGFDFSYCVLHGPKKDEDLRKKYDIYILNYDGLPWFVKNFSPKNFVGCILVCDESTKLKHTNTLRFKTLKPILDIFVRRYILTGTPAPNGLLDLFGQAYILDHGYALGRYITHYRINYFYSSGYGGYTWLPQPDAGQRIYKKLAPYVFHVDRNVIKLPPLKNVVIPIALPEKAVDAYKKMEHEFVLSLRHGEIIASNAGVMSSKCRQICNGGVYSADRQIHHIHDAKTDAAVDLVEELSGQPVLIVYEFEHDLERLKKAFGKHTEVLGFSAKKDARVIDGWNAGKIRVLLAQSATVAYGLNLQAVGRNIVWYGLTWNLEHYIQAVDRLWRQGQKRTVFNYHLVAQDTIDEIMMKVLASKRRTQEDLLIALRKKYE